jgi:ABC-type phosphate/phosphonate transport system substrate-binding protein
MNFHRRENALRRTSCAVKKGRSAGIGIRRAPIVALLCLSLSATTVRAGAPQGPETLSSNEDGVINLAYSSLVFTGVSKSDALAAIKVWQDAVARNRGIHGRLNTTIYEDMETMAKALAAGRIDVLVVLAGEYLELKASHNITPTFVPIRNGLIQDESLLLVRRDSGIRDIGRLEGKSIMIQERCGVNLGGVWLNSMLLERGYPKAPDFFARCITTSKTSTTALQVFFGKANAALISNMDFQALVELNPQLGRQLATLESSQAYVTGVICVRDDYHQERDTLLDVLAELHMEPRGQQVLMLFKVDRLAPFEDRYLDSARNILGNYESLTGRIADQRR